MASLLFEWVTPDFGKKIKQFGTKTGVRLIDLAKYVATTGV